MNEEQMGRIIVGGILVAMWPYFVSIARSLVSRWTCQNPDGRTNAAYLIGYAYSRLRSPGKRQGR